MKYVLLKKIVIVVGKLIRSRVLQGGVGFHGALKGGDRARNFFLSCGVGRGWDKTKQCGSRAKTSSFGPALAYCHS